MPSITKPTMQPRIDSSPILLLIFEFLEPLPLAVLARLRLPPTIRPHAGAAPGKPPASCQTSMGLQHQVQQAHKKHIRSDTNDQARQPYRRSPRPRRRAILALWKLGPGYAAYRAVSRTNCTCSKFNFRVPRSVMVSLPRPA